MNESEHKRDARAFAEALRPLADENESIYDDDPRNPPPYRERGECDCDLPECSECRERARAAEKLSLEREADAEAAHAAAMAKLEEPRIIETTYRVTLSLTVDLTMEHDEGVDASANARIHAEREIADAIHRRAKSIDFIDIEALECDKKEKKP